MPDTQYLVSCLVSMVGGFIVGVALGAALDGRLGRFFRTLPQRAALIGGLVVLVGAVSTVMLFLQGQELDRQAEALAAQREYMIRVTNCQATANEAFREALATRSAATTGQRDAQIEQIDRQIEQNRSQGQLLAITARNERMASLEAIREYTEKLDRNTDALEQLRAKLIEVKATSTQNPLPQLKCGAP